jgi:hypothetical protein
MKESNQPEIELMDTPPEAFKILLKYVYAGNRLRSRICKAPGGASTLFKVQTREQSAYIPRLSQIYINNFDIGYG